jgi:hypothetical protein
MESKFTTLMGGKEITVTRRDGSAESVWVRQLPIEDYPKLLLLLDDELGQVELYCLVAVGGLRSAGEAQAGGSRPAEQEQNWAAVPAGWAKTLRPESHELVINTAEGLNRDFFSRWMRRRMGRLELVRPGLADQVFAGLAGGAGAVPAGSPNLSPRSPQSAGSAGARR